MSTHNSLESSPKFPRRRIPATLNLAIASTQLGVLLTLIIAAGKLPFWPWTPICGLSYALVMNSAYLMLHEAEHGMLHPQKWVNDSVGTLLALFFPAPFHLLRQGHLGHHVRNRTDDEAFDHYFPGDNVIWKKWAFYNILVGGFWLCIALSNLILPFRPGLWSPTAAHFDRPTEALIESLNPKFGTLIRFEALGLLALHSTLLFSGVISLGSWLTLMGVFGVSWSSMQYMHHYETPRDVHKGARNLRTFRWLDSLWLNHNWHQRHHEQPNIPWLYLPEIDDGENAPRESMMKAWLKQWRGPTPGERTVPNPHAGKRIR